MKIADLDTLNKLKNKGLHKIFSSRPRVTVGMGTCGIGNGAQAVYEAFKILIKKKKIKINLTKTGCFGFCAQEPLVNIYLPGKPLVILCKVSAKDVSGILKDIAYGKIPNKKVLCKIESWDHLTASVNYGCDFHEIPLWNQIPFYKWQKKIVLRNCGIINPEDIEEYMAVGGYQSLYKVLKGISSDKIIKELKISKLRGRGGAGFPTGIKWERMINEKADKKYIICNADEGDPGAFMNRNELESDPHMVIEGMIIGAYTTGASAGIIYIRAEYPLAVKRLKQAIEQAQKCGLLGNSIFRTGFNFKLSIVEGAGAFVCGEETSLIASIEGYSGKPRPRPPYPTKKGLWGYPTNINNVETWCNIPVIIKKGGRWFSETGTEKSAGTKVFSLVGKIRNTGLVELPLGTPLKTIVYNIGGGSEDNKRIKSVQTGGPSGGCLPHGLFDTPVDYESLAEIGAIMGSGGMVVMDEDNCMVDVACYFLEFTTGESCGKCVPCREGLFQALEILKSISEGKGKEQDLQVLQILADVIKDTAFCGLGQTAPNPIITTLRYFREEYEEHIREKRCNAGICESLFLAPCENTCPLHMNIPGFLQLLKEEKIDETFESIIQDNPLPAITGRVCHYPCESRCRRNDIDEPVSPKEIHRYIADAIYKTEKDKDIFQKLAQQKLPPTRKKIAIVGSGPAGLTAAFYLSRLGHGVTIYESKRQAGGMLRYAIPEYRLSKSVVEREINNIKFLGVRIIFNKALGKNVTLKKLEADYNAVFLAVGAQKEATLVIAGENLTGVYSGIKVLESVAAKKKINIGKRAVVIGGGNTAIDVARILKRLGVDVTIAYRREKKDMPADKEEVKETQAEGIKFRFLSAPDKITGKRKVEGIRLIKMTPGEFDSSGRRSPVPTGRGYQVPCDAVILAVGEEVDSRFVKPSRIEVDKRGAIKINKFTMRTQNPKIYAGGDGITGPATVSEAMAAGKKAARMIDLELMGEDRFSKLFKKFLYNMAAPLKPADIKKQKSKQLSIKQRKNNFKEIFLGFNKLKSEKETIRCLRCDVKDLE